MLRLHVHIACLLLVSSIAAACAPLPPGEAAPTPSLEPWPTATGTPREPSPVPTVAAPMAVGPTATPFKHVVAQGESLLGIAGLYGVSLDSLQAINPGLNPFLLSIGQELLIPGPEGTPIGSLIPTSTPIPLSLQPPSCYPQVTGGLRCLTGIRNPTSQDLENLVVEIRLQDESGDVLQAEQVFPPLNRLPAGETMPLSATFPDPPPKDFFPSALVLSVITARDTEARYDDIVIERTLDERQEGGLSWRIGGTVQAPADMPLDNRTLVLVTAFDDAGRVIGYAVWEADPALEPGDRQDFSARVFSLGPEIARVELLAESYRLASE
jgi:LysM repeat protein